MNSLPFIPKIELTATEEDIIHAHLTQPVVKKYFMKLAWDLTEDLLINSSPAKGESAESFLIRKQEVSGRLGAISSLLDIQPASQPSSN